MTICAYLCNVDQHDTHKNPCYDDTTGTTGTSVIALSTNLVATVYVDAGTARIEDEALVEHDKEAVRVSVRFEGMHDQSRRLDDIEESERRTVCLERIA